MNFGYKKKAKSHSLKLSHGCVLRRQEMLSLIRQFKALNMVSDYSNSSGRDGFQPILINVVRPKV